MTKHIPLTQGYYAIIDDADYELVSCYKWQTRKHHRNVYANAKLRGGLGNKSIDMHRLIMNPKQGEQVDHIDHNGLNNTRANLRIVTSQQNQWNMRKAVDSSNPYKGASWRPDIQKWESYIRHNKKKLHIGWHVSAEDAARAYDAKAKELRGEFALLNLP